MEYREEGDCPGSVPEFGSIFMSNAATKKECLRLKLLGLPSTHENFVRCVKAEMILFLFEFEKRELHGVYRACSDGAVNIVPHAFISSGKQFPAQVRFTVIWNCKPLSEHEFRDAIRENYYSNKKFNFGLSEDQVRRLLCLFSSRKLENRVPRRQFGGEKTVIQERIFGKKTVIQERISGNKKFSSRNKEEMLIEEYSPDHPIIMGCNRNSPSDSKRPDNKRFLENSLGYDRIAEHEGTALGRIKKVVVDSMNSMEAKIGFDYDMHHNSRDSLYSSTKQNKDNQFLHYDNGDFLARVRRDSDDGRFQLGDIREHEYSPIDDGFRLGKPVESFDIPQAEFRRPIDDQRLSGRIWQESQPFVDRSLGSITSPLHSGHPTDRIKPSDDNNMLLESVRVENAYTIGENIGPPRYGDLHQHKQEPSFNSSKPMLEAHYSLSQNQPKSSIKQYIYGMSYPTSFAMEKNKYEVSNPTSRDSVLTQAVSYDREFPPDVNGSSRSVQDLLPHHSCVENIFSASNKTSLYCTKAEGFYPQSSGALGRVSEVPLHGDEDLYSHPHRRMSKSLLRGGYCGKMEQPLISDEIYEDPPPFCRSPIYERRNISPSVRFDENSLASQDRFIHQFQENVNKPEFSDDQDLMVNNGMGSAHSGSSYEKSYAYDIGSYQYPEDSDRVPPNLKNRKASVFARLSMSSSKGGEEREGYMEYEELDASVDEVMESLFGSLSHKITYAANSPSVNRYDTKESNMRYHQIEVNELTMMTPTMIKKCTPVEEYEKNEEDVPKETRVMDFKRRSETKRSQNGEKKKSSIGSALEQETNGSIQKAEGNREVEGEREVEGKRIKRRKLIRPSFGKKEQLNDNYIGDGSSESQLLLPHENSNNSKVVLGQSQRNPNCPSPNSQPYRKLVRPVFSKKELKDNSERDGVSDLHLPTHESSNENKTATCDFSGKSQLSLNHSSRNSQTSDTGPRTGLV